MRSTPQDGAGVCQCSQHLERVGQAMLRRLRCYLYVGSPEYIGAVHGVSLGDDDSSQHG